MYVDTLYIFLKFFQFSAESQKKDTPTILGIQRRLKFFEKLVKEFFFMYMKIFKKIFIYSSFSFNFSEQMNPTQMPHKPI